ncbi:TPA: flagellar basal body L-ring protein FlgH [Candidatus Poribacteria bacterium]|nr:flagellar basal body L-ring protein FlgH [Candidatus Poribacteria bacterium]
MLKGKDRRLIFAPLCLLILAGLAFGKPGKLSEISLFTDNKAHREGDIVKVLVVESASANKTSSAQTSRTSGKKGAISTFPWLKRNPLAKGVDLSSESTFSGSGSISTKGELKAEVAAVVKEVLPNGNLLVEGEREIVIDGEKQVIYVKGIVRPVDITPQNTVLSTNLAESEIRYEGKGMISRQQKPGFLSRLLDWLWIF